MPHGAGPEGDEALGVRQAAHLYGQLSAIVGAGFHLSTHIGPFPLVPVGHAGELGGSAPAGLQRAIGQHGPGLTAVLANQLVSLAAHLVLRSAVGALVEHLFEALGALVVVHLKALGLQPGVVVILECIHKARVNYVQRKALQVFRGKEQLEVGLGRFDAARMKVPEGGIDMMAVADEHRHRHSQKAAELSQRLGQHGGGTAKRIASLGINHGDIAVFNHFSQVPHQGEVVGEFTLADAPHVAKKPFPADKSVNRHHIVCPFGIDGLCEHLEIHEGVVVAQQQVRRLELLGTLIMNDGLMS